MSLHLVSQMNSNFWLVESHDKQLYKFQCLAISLVASLMLDQEDCIAADPEGVQYPPLRQNYYIFMENFQKN